MIVTTAIMLVSFVFCFQQAFAAMNSISKELPAKPFHDGDIVAFIGDSTNGAVSRLEWDIMPCKPTVATILLGMNDINRDLYAEGREGDDIDKQRNGMLDLHRIKMKELAQKLKESGCRIIFITPSIFDQTSTMAKTNFPGANDALAACADNDILLAKNFGGEMVDFQGPMLAINKKIQQTDPAASINGNDRIHPGATGHFVMAYVFLKNQGLPKFVANTGIDAAAQTVTRAENCSLDGLAFSDNGISFNYRAKALPFPVTSQEKNALGLVPFMEELNCENLSVANLTPGRYELSIGGEAVGTYSSAELQQGVNLALNQKTPQYKQALRVMQINDERFELEKRLRGLAKMYYSFLRPANISWGNFKGAKPILEKVVNDMETKKTSTAKYYRCLLEAWLEDKPKEENIHRNIEKLIAKMYEINKPRKLLVRVRSAQSHADQPH
jgi:lysophospholipase L1-like esterase